jgi:hypothetical protein
MAEAEIIEDDLPMALNAGARARLVERIAPQAFFLSQLIAERHRLGQQRERRQAPVIVALGTYDAGSRAAERRLPPGYRTTIDA